MDRQSLPPLGQPSGRRRVVRPGAGPRTGRQEDGLGVRGRTRRRLVVAGLVFVLYVLASPWLLVFLFASATGGAAPVFGLFFGLLASPVGWVVALAGARTMRTGTWQVAFSLAAAPPAITLLVATGDLVRPRAGGMTIGDYFGVIVESNLRFLLIFLAVVGLVAASAAVPRQADGSCGRQPDDGGDGPGPGGGGGAGAA